MGQKLHTNHEHGESVWHHKPQTLPEKLVILQNKVYSKYEGLILKTHTFPYNLTTEVNYSKISLCCI